MKRRDFITRGSQAAAGVSLLATSALGKEVGSSAKTEAEDAPAIAFGAIGLNGITKANVEAALKYKGAKLVAVSDVDDSVITKTVADFEAAGQKPTVYKDWRKLIADPAVTAVLIGTPDHWHALMAAQALKAGKHVYVEKPLANTVEECDYLVKLAASAGKVVQVGQQQRSAQHWQDMITFVQSGALGRIRQVRCWSYVNWKPPVPVQPDGPVPAGVDYEMWLGPAPAHAFNPNRFHFTWRWFWDYAGGLMTDWGVHMLDMALLAMKAQYPQSVSATGGKFAYPTDAMQIPDTLTALYQYPDFILTWEHTFGIGLGPGGKPNGVQFVGENGTLTADRGGWEIAPELNRDRPNPGYKMPAMPSRKSQSEGRTEHLANFFNAIVKGAKPICPMEDGALVASVAHMGNIAFKTGRTIHWDAAKRQFVDKGQPDKEANALLKHHYRAPWVLPA